MEDLVESILDYVRSDYTDYAIMINGEWGSRKNPFLEQQNQKKNRIHAIKWQKIHNNIYVTIWNIKPRRNKQKNIYRNNTTYGQKPKKIHGCKWTINNSRICKNRN